MTALSSSAASCTVRRKAPLCPASENVRRLAMRIGPYSTHEARCKPARYANRAPQKL
ncbi:unnamed protein product [Soboliphyme baturini]|uniref:Uncharacterized protein n=1 Tax=Soboliphyme baturini TaxID=241478 RepID=A0A183IY70_9BILA|nr:unnamed protein product [Soboliphyme baturini]